MTSLPSRIRASLPTMQRDFWRGIVGCATIVLLFVAVIGYQHAGMGNRTVDVLFAQSAGLQSGDDVRIAGVSAGKVDSLALTGDHVSVALEVDDSVELGSDTRAEIKLSTILGSRYVSLTPDGDTPLGKNPIDLSHSTVPFDLQKAIQTGTPVIEQVDARTVRESLTTVADQLEGTPELTGQALDSISTLSRVISDRRDQIAALLDDADQVTERLSENSAALTSMLGQGAALAGSIVSQRGAVAKLIAATDALTAQLDSVFTENRAAIEPLIGQLTALSQGLANNDDTLRRVYEGLPVTVRQMTNAFGNGPYADIATPWSLLPDNWLCSANVVQGCR
ncbi:putative MCE family protein [Rhodococcus sp. AW25M09]|uniref:MCE family protein n=1 Tax=Rhodococcus sp. AW25M09 TaxID=1268303 RepID=UPI0002ACB77D|nr:MCE family protein [Rhodococcus sp. AW25M09]CCQ13511.1 putative MCE family protein [Rhodococcus sp. AW25M09]